MDLERLLMGGNVASNITFSRQRVPMVDSSTLDDRTRPALEDPGSTSARLRYSQWMARPSSADHALSLQAMMSQANPARR
jgi:hypothetical protein